ncbi:interleukin-7 isoform X2 [Artibeus jamaicensis]|uniref:interleukin-7 isoform X2 n=1 Tax=Artibeus jamaicensis TaxID=9417 RepID=UPI00187BD61D|nr:interleukin-7 isoform X2 [Artibeus jamaicensis]
MFHVSFRYIFGIPPLILVLLPVASSDCEIEGKNGEEYQHIIMVSFNELEHIRENASNCLNNEPNFFKRHSCDDDKEATFLKTAARKLKQFVKMNIPEDFKHHLSVVSQGTLKLLNCTRKEIGRGPRKGSETEERLVWSSENTHNMYQIKKKNNLPWVKPSPLRIWKRKNL